MHRLSQFLVINDGDSRRKKKKNQKKTPKLERMNGRKNIDYDIPVTSTSSFSDYGSSGYNLSFDSQLIPTSFRIDGSDLGQLDVVYRSLGLTNPEDFGIDVSSWEARKVRSICDDVSSSGLNLRHEKFDENVEKCDEIVEKLDGNVRVSGSNGKRVGNGIKGVRPPVLSPPDLSIATLGVGVGGGGGCEWDSVRAFGSGEGCIDDEEGEEEVEDVRNRLERTKLSASCSFTTSNEDDSSSTTTEPPSSVSPDGFGLSVSNNGRFRHIKVTQWQRGELLGRGSFGSVYEGICDGGYFIAVKEVSLLDQGEMGRQSVIQLEQEIALLSQFEHENIVRYHGTDKDESKLYIFLELVTKGSLLSLYQRYHLHDCQVSSYTRQILHGLKYLHDRSVVHRDVKCANILVDANGSVKLADFGLAKAATLNDVKSCKGTAFWMAPEVVNQKNQGYGLAADIWSLGCTVLEMLTRRIPYSPMECMAALFRIGNGIAPPVPDSLSKEARDFISQCFHVNPRDRPTATQLLDHPFVRRPLPSILDYSPGQSWKQQR